MERVKYIIFQNFRDYEPPGMSMRFGATPASNSHSRYVPHTYSQPTIPTMLPFKAPVIGGGSGVPELAGLFNSSALDVIPPTQNLNRSLSSG